MNNNRDTSLKGSCTWANSSSLKRTFWADLSLCSHGVNISCCFWRSMKQEGSNESRDTTSAMKRQSHMIITWCPCQWKSFDKNQTMKITCWSHDNHMILYKAKFLRGQNFANQSKIRCEAINYLIFLKCKICKNEWNCAKIRCHYIPLMGLSAKNITTSLLPLSSWGTTTERISFVFSIPLWTSNWTDWAYSEPANEK